MPTSFSIRTPGYWPLPKFEKINFDGKWIGLHHIGGKEKDAEYELELEKAPKSPIPAPSFVIIESRITKALPKKIVLSFHARRFVLSRWIGGIYSSINSRNLSHLRNFYNSIAPIYRYHVEPERAHQLAAFVPYLPPHKKILDASAGDCTLAKTAGKNYGFFCADISEGMLNLRDKKLIPSSHIRIASASRLPFHANSFDAVTHTFSNIHSLDRKKFFKEFHRVLRPGGLLLYHPVKSPGEQWAKDFIPKTEWALHSAGFSKVRRVATESTGKKKTTLVFYLAEKA